MTLLLAFTLTACVGLPAGGVYGKDDTDITVDAGKTFTIELEENPTTGYEWTADISDKAVVSLEKQEYRQSDAGADVVGAGGIKALTFKAVKKGTAVLTLVYERNFEEDSAQETLVYNITVQ